MSLEDELKRPKSVSSEAGSVEYVNPKDAIELDKYKRKVAEEEQGKVGLKRCQWGIIRGLD